MQREYLSKKELCEYLGISARTSEDWVKSRGLPHFRIGGKILRFKRSQVDEWLEQFQVKQTNKVDLMVDEIIQSFQQKAKG